MNISVEWVGERDGIYKTIHTKDMIVMYGVRMEFTFNFVRMSQEITFGYGVH